MNKKFAFAVVSTVLLAAAIGCSQRAKPATDVQVLVRDYQKTWDATYAVMSKHFLIAKADPNDGLIIAAPLRSDGKMAQAETRVKARIVAAEYGGYAVEVRATNYMQLSEPHALSSKTAAYEWIPVDYDERLQTKLLNEIDELRFGGQKAAEENKFLQSPKEPVPMMPK